MPEYQLVKYEAARIALLEAKSVDEAKDIHDKAEAIRAYARQANDNEMVSWASEIKLRAMRRMGELLGSEGVERDRGKGGDRKSQSRPTTVKLADFGISRDASSLSQKIATVPEQIFENHLIGMREQHREITVAGIARLIEQNEREIKARQRQAERTKDLEQAQFIGAIPENVFQTILIDPPWDWGDEGDIDQLGRAKPCYATMPIEDLLEIPIGNYADKNCHLYLWITNRSLPKGFMLIERWSFRYITCLTWCKPSIGMGNYFRGSTEHILFGVKGSLSLLRKDVGTWFQFPRGPHGHSSKPIEIYDLIESCSPGPYLEIFARNKREKWHSWGNNAL